MLTSDKEIVSIRVFDVIPEIMFRAWTEPAILAQWWGPKGFSNTFHEFDCAPGGIWKFVQHGPDGKDYKNECVFILIDKPRLLVWDHTSGPQFYIVASFTEESGKTRVIFKMIFNSVKECERVKQFAADANEQNFDKLETALRKLTTEIAS
jgi:uncharacterized protein YndB with AHSA1/START domain